MQSLLGYMRKAAADYGMIEEGDTVAVGLSGGKDSMALLAGLCRLRAFKTMPRFNVVALTIDPCFDEVQTDYTAATTLCEEWSISHVIRRSDLGKIIFSDRQEKNPCSLCARMRRGMLHDMAKENGCNKLALGHHYDDAVETFVMNLLHEGRLGCFQPVTYLSRKDLTMIRPLLYAPERLITNTVNRVGLPVVKSKCPVDGATARQEAKLWLREMEKSGHPAIKERIFGAMRRGHLSGW